MAKILLVDDDDLLRDTVEQMLELDRHAVVLANNGEEALSRFGRGAFDLLLTDVLMPGLDGAQLIVAVRKLQPDLPIIAMSGGRRVLSPQFNLQTAALAGATCQLNKPFDRQQLRACVAEALASARPA